MHKWNKMEGVTRIVFTFPKGEKVTIDAPLWEQDCKKTGKKFFLTSDGRDFTVNNGWLLAEYEGPYTLTDEGAPNTILTEKED